MSETVEVYESQKCKTCPHFRPKMGGGYCGLIGSIIIAITEDECKQALEKHSSE